MNEIAFITRNDVFTDSLIVAENIGYAHKSITKHIKKHQTRFERMGNIYYSRRVTNQKGGQFKPIELNEQQAIFLMTLLGNENEQVLDFKMKLAMEFVKMRKILLEKQTTDWQQARLQSKQVRIDETDAIKTLVEYAKQQGSKNANKLYIVYSKLVKQLAGHTDRDIADVEMLTMIIAFERILYGIITTEMQLNTYYKEIYQIAKSQLMSMKRLWAVPRLSA